MKRIVILVSGRGSNAEAIIERCAAEGWPAQVVALISNRPGAVALDFAAGRGIGTVVVDHRLFDSREDFDAELARVIDSYAPDLLLLAGFMRILGDAFVSRYAGRMMNVHPSLLPAFAGLHTHQRAIAAGCKLAGATVHFVTATLDHGPIVAQAAVPVLADDTAEALSARVLALEHVIYPLAVRWFVLGQLQLQDGQDGQGRQGGLVRQTSGESQLLLG